MALLAGISGRIRRPWQRSLSLPAERCCPWCPWVGKCPLVLYGQIPGFILTGGGAAVVGALFAWVLSFPASGPDPERLASTTFLRPGPLATRAASDLAASPATRCLLAVGLEAQTGAL